MTLSLPVGPSRRHRSPQVQRRWRSRVRWLKLRRRRAWRNERKADVPTLDSLNLELDSIGERYKRHKDEERAKRESATVKTAVATEDWVERRWKFNPEYHPMADRWEATAATSAKKPAIGGLIGGLRWRGFRDVTTSWFGNESNKPPSGGIGNLSARQPGSARLSRQGSFEHSQRDFSTSVGKWLFMGTDGRPVVQDRPT